jgi:hypothetical protein
MRGIDPTIQAHIEESQPYHAVRLEEHAFYILHELCNKDKHRLLHTVTTARGATTAHLLYTRATGKELTIAPFFAEQGPVQDGTPVIRFRISGQSGGDQVKMETNLQFDIAFDQGAEPVAGEPVVQVLSTMAFGFRSVVDQFISLGGV